MYLFNDAHEVIYFKNFLVRMCEEDPEDPPSDPDDPPDPPPPKV